MGEITYYAKILIKELEKRGIKAESEYNDGFKSVDLFIEEANLFIEVDGSHHTTDPEQALTDLKRANYSIKDGRFTYHIPNSLLHKYPGVSADIIKEMVYNLKIKKSEESKLNSKVLSSEQYIKIKEELKKELQDDLNSTFPLKPTYLFPKKNSRRKIIFMIFAVIILILLILVIWNNENMANTSTPNPTVKNETNSTIYKIEKPIIKANEPTPKVEPIPTPKSTSIFQFQDSFKTDDEIKQEIADKLAEYDRTTTNAMNRISVYNLASAWGLPPPANPSLSGNGCGYTLVIDGYEVVVKALFYADCMGGRNSNGYIVEINRE